MRYFANETKSLVFQLGFLKVFVFIILAAMITGCSIKTNETAPVLLSPLENADNQRLIDEVNRFSQVKSIRGKFFLEIIDNSFAESGIDQKYRKADSTIIVQQPRKINFKIQVPIVGQDIVQMTSDGDKFRVAIIYGVEEKYKRFITGTNSADYTKEKENLQKIAKEDAQQINALSNLRPQHFTDALLMRPAPLCSQEQFYYTKSEIFQEERENAKRKSTGASSRVIRGYYLLDEHRLKNGELHLTRRFWFNRVGQINLSRQQIFDENGTLVSDITYGALRDFPDGVKMPAQVEIRRPLEKYTVKLTYQAPEATKINENYPEKAFVLENSWHLPEVDLDKGKQINQDETDIQCRPF